MGRGILLHMFLRLSSRCRLFCSAKQSVLTLCVRWLACGGLLFLGQCRAGTAIETAEVSPQTSGVTPPPIVVSPTEPLGPGDANITGPISAGGTISFQNIGAAGWWGRRLNAKPGDSACNVQSETLHLGQAGGDVFCCRGRHDVADVPLSPFDAQMTFILRGPIRVKQMAVYHPVVDANLWTRVSWWSTTTAPGENLKWTGPGAAPFDGRIGDSCQWYATQATPFACGADSVPYCPGTGPDINYDGWEGSKLIVFLAAFLPHDDPDVASLSCASQSPQPNAPWIGFSASELMRDGWGKYFPCHCYDNTNGPVGAGCGEINVFETVAESEGPLYGNQQVISTGVRSYQVGSMGGHVCGTAACDGNSFPATADLLDACSKSVRNTGATIVAGANNSDCPIWRRAADDRYYYILLDAQQRTIAVGIVHPQNIPPAAAALLPQLPGALERDVIDRILALQLPR
jgi:hypothetical protein